MQTSTRVSVIVFGLLLGMLSLYLVLGSWNEGVESVEDPRAFVRKQHEGKEGTYMPEGWTGLPISYDNDLYIDPFLGGTRYKATYQHLLKTIITMPRGTFNADTDNWERLAFKYCPVIGWNGFFDALYEAWRTTGVESSPMIHSVGEILGRYASKPRHAVEISSRDILHKAPLHGSVWVSIMAVGSDDIDELFNLVNNELCYFRNEENMGNIWISCAHGVGHGLGELYGLDGIAEAAEICGSQSDSQFQYACATGIYMALEQETPVKSFYPCDTNRFPGACYRFKNRLFGSVFYNTTGACMTQPDMYHTIGCIWGQGHVAIAPTTQYADSCAEYLPERDEEPMASYHVACLDGFFASHEGGMMPEGPMKDNLCEDLVEYPKSYEACKFKTRMALNEFTFEDDDTVYYNTKLLEADYDPSIPPSKADWLPEWNKITIKGPNMMSAAPTGGHNHGGHE